MTNGIRSAAAKGGQELQRAIRAGLAQHPASGTRNAFPAVRAALPPAVHQVVESVPVQRVLRVAPRRLLLAIHGFVQWSTPISTSTFALRLRALHQMPSWATQATLPSSRLRAGSSSRMSMAPRCMRPSNLWPTPTERS